MDPAQPQSFRPEDDTDPLSPEGQFCDEMECHNWLCRPSPDAQQVDMHGRAESTVDDLTPRRVQDLLLQATHGLAIPGARCTGQDTTGDATNRCRALLAGILEGTKPDDCISLPNDRGGLHLPLDGALMSDGELNNGWRTYLQDFARSPTPDEPPLCSLRLGHSEHALVANLGEDFEKVSAHSDVVCRTHHGTILSVGVCPPPEGEHADCPSCNDPAARLWGQEADNQNGRSPQTFPCLPDTVAPGMHDTIEPEPHDTPAPEPHDTTAPEPHDTTAPGLHDTAAPGLHDTGAKRVNRLQRRKKVESKAKKRKTLLSEAENDIDLCGVGLLETTDPPRQGEVGRPVNEILGLAKKKGQKRKKGGDSGTGGNGEEFSTKTQEALPESCSFMPGAQFSRRPPR